ncbi:unnamed protein product [Protopolystoma xenopodis]|uniref:Uncharacterized protein n=1 Tax=Protopolystoma xenopodis TaxID=117903 RepID=A0A448WJ02_9PLAT|nr:unnamed protein product [Protopolystoma xenopodis]
MGVALNFGHSGPARLDRSHLPVRSTCRLPHERPGSRDPFSDRAEWRVVFVVVRQAALEACETFGFHLPPRLYHRKRPVDSAQHWPNPKTDMNQAECDAR